VVLFQDECHLLWGDVIGYAWGKRGERAEVSIKNERKKQSYYGTVNFLTGQVFATPYPTGNSEGTIKFLKSLRQRFQGRRIILIWDGASYHRSKAVKDYLKTLNGDCAEDERLIDLVRFAPNAPEQNPMEDVWLAGKTRLRKQHSRLDDFETVKETFFTFINQHILKSIKFDWYKPSYVI